MIQEDEGDYTYVDRIQVPLSHGSLLLMSGSTQDDWQVGSTNQTQRVSAEGISGHLIYKWSQQDLLLFINKSRRWNPGLLMEVWQVNDFLFSCISRKCEQITFKYINMKMLM